MVLIVAVAAVVVGLAIVVAGAGHEVQRGEIDYPGIVAAALVIGGVIAGTVAG